jgi:hypothetical protein
MILPKAFALTVQLIMPVAASDRVPQLNVEPVCKGIAEQGGVTFHDPAVEQEKKNCIELEQAMREQLVQQWSSFSGEDRTHCVNETTMGGLSSYTELLTCLEMARDVRAMRVAAAPSQAAAPTRAPSSPSTPTVPPVPAEPISRPTSANEPPKKEVDSMRKELEKAKTDAENVKASEAMARKLADAEAALQRAKEEAGRATKEAEQAKADAQVARELRAQAERKLADAEAARMAAEGREKACQSAAKSQPQLGTRLRGWFGHKESHPKNP